MYIETYDSILYCAMLYYTIQYDTKLYDSILYYSQYMRLSSSMPL